MEAKCHFVNILTLGRSRITVDHCLAMAQFLKTKQSITVNPLDKPSNFTPLT